MCLAVTSKKVEPKVEVKAQKKRVKKDKDAPKKPMPPFFCYQKQRRDILKAEKPTADNTQLIKVSLPGSARGAYRGEHVRAQRAGLEPPQVR